MKVILNADDLGYNLDVNRAIFSLIAQNKITSATLMANGGAFQDAINQIKNFSNASFGVHLTLTEFSSLTRPDIFYDTKLIDDNGIFSDNIRHMRFSPRLALQDAILNEWKQQITKILDHGVMVSHLDSHHHTHTTPWLLPTFKKLQKEFKIRKARIALNWFYEKEITPSYKGILWRGMWNFALKNVYKTKTTDYFSSFTWFLENLRNEEYPLKGTVELNCHPGQPYAMGEYELLCSDWIDQLPLKIEMISYNQL